jgi:hypothetical protein
VDRIYKMPQRGIVGDYVWGTVDGWRRPRPEWWLAKKANSPIRIEPKLLAIPPAGRPVEVSVENLNFWNDLNDYICKWRLSSEQGQVRARVAPQAKGSLSIQTKRPPRASDTLVLEFYDQSGRMTDGYKLTFSPHAIPALPNSGKAARIVEMPATTYLQSAEAIRLLGRNTELSYDKRNGQMLWCLAGRESVILSGLAYHALSRPRRALSGPAHMGVFQRRLQG